MQVAFMLRAYTIWFENLLVLISNESWSIRTHLTHGYDRLNHWNFLTICLEIGSAFQNTE